MEITDRIIRVSPGLRGKGIEGAVIVETFDNDNNYLVRFRKLDGTYSALPPVYIEAYTSEQDWVRRVAAGEVAV